MFLYRTRERINGNRKELKHFDLAVDTYFELVNEEPYSVYYTRLTLLNQHNVGPFVLATLYYKQESDAAKWHDLLFKAVDDTSSIEEAINIFKHLANSYVVFSQDNVDKSSKLQPL